MADGNTLDKRSYNKRFREENAVIPRTTRWRLMKRLKESTENANIMQERLFIFYFYDLVMAHRKLTPCRDVSTHCPISTPRLFVNLRP